MKGAASVTKRLLVIQNRQRVRSIDLRRLRRILQNVLEKRLQIPAWELGLHVVDDREMAALNHTYLQHEGSTDVITFDHSETKDAADASEMVGARSLHGEIFISVPDAIAQAREFGTTWQAELIRYAIHAILHLLGHDDLEPSARRRMKRAEDTLVKEISREHPLTRLADRPRRARIKPSSA